MVLTRILCLGSTPPPSSQRSPRFLAILALVVLTLTPFAPSPITGKLPRNPLDHSALLPESTQTGDFNITASPPPPKDVNQSATTTIQIGIVGVFTQEISLTASPTDGLSCGAISPPIVMGSGMATASCVSSVANNYTLTVIGRSGSLVHSTNATFDFMDFAIYATSPTGNANSSISSLISITAANGFSNIVTLRATSQSGLHCGIITPDFVTGSGTADISCQAANLGTYSLTINGTSSHLTHSIGATFLIEQIPDFSLIATSPKTSDVGQQATATISVQGTHAFGDEVTFADSPPPNLSCQGITPGAVIGPETATVSCTSKAGGIYVLNITGTSGSLSHSTTARFDFVDFKLTALAPPPSTVESPAILEVLVSPVNGFSRPVTLTESLAHGLQCNAMTQTILLDGTDSIWCQASVAGSYTINVTGTSNSLTHSVISTLNFQDFQLNASTPEAVGVDSYSILTITLTSQNGFAGRVHLSDIVPAGLNCKPISPAELDPVFSATLSCESDLSGSLSLTIVGDSGSVVHRLIVTFTFATLDFAITTGASSLNMSKGSSGTTIVKVTEMYGFSSPVSLSVNSPSGLSCSLNPASIDPQTPSTLTCEANNSGDYTIIVTGTAGGRTRNAALHIHVSTASQASPMPATLLGLGIFIWYAIIGATLAILIGAGLFILKKSKLLRTRKFEGTL